jgi:hypothetical protein
VRPSNAIECSPCRRVSINYSDSLLFHGGDTGSTPVRDANNLRLDTLASSLFTLNIKFSLTGGSIDSRRFPLISFAAVLCYMTRIEKIALIRKSRCKVIRVIQGVTFKDRCASLDLGISDPH